MNELRKKLRAEAEQKLEKMLKDLSAAVDNVVRDSSVSWVDMLKILSGKRTDSTP